MDFKVAFCKAFLFVCFFIRRVVGPAVTFKVGRNSKNVTTADVANVAGRFSLAG